MSEPVSQRIRFVRDSDAELYIEVPGQPGKFASASDFNRGVKYVERYLWTMAELEIDGPVTIEWDSAAP